MNIESLTLNQLRVGDCLTVADVYGEDSMRRRLEDLGVVAGTQISCLMRSPMGDPCAYWIRGAVIALRDQDAQQIIGTRCPDRKERLL